MSTQNESALLAEFEARIARGEKVEPGDWMPEEYRQNLDRAKGQDEAGKVRELKGFGAKTEKTILDGIALAEVAGQRLYWCDADEIAQALRAHLGTQAAVERLELAGSYRRGKETVGDLDVLVTAKDGAKIGDKLTRYENVAEVLAHGPTRATVVLRSGLQVDVRAVPEESYGAALIYFTGSKAHNIALRHALQGGSQRRHPVKIPAPFFRRAKQLEIIQHHLWLELEQLRIQLLI